MTIITPLRRDRIDTPFVLDSPVNDETLKPYVDQMISLSNDCRACFISAHN